MRPLADETLQDRLHLNGRCFGRFFIPRFEIRRHQKVAALQLKAVPGVEKHHGIAGFGRFGELLDRRLGLRNACLRHQRRLELELPQRLLHIGGISRSVA